jgi:replicative DNA helicase
MDIEAIKRPQSLSIERQVLAAGIFDPQVLPEIVAFLEEDDFYSPAHRKIFSALRRMCQNGAKVDLVLLGRQLEKQGALEEVGGTGYLVVLARAITTTAHAEDHCRALREDAVRRTLIEEGLGLAEDAAHPEREATGIIRRAITKFQKMLRKLRPRQEQSWGDTLEAYHKRILGEGPPETKYSTGLLKLDQCLGGGMSQGTLTTIDGDTSVGKTALAAQFALRAARDARRIVWFSFEMSISQMIGRFLQLQTGIWVRPRDPQYWQDHPTECGLVAEGIGRLANYHMHLFDDGRLTPLGMEAELEAVRSEHGPIDLVVVDYVQMVVSDSENRKENRATKVSGITGAIKRLCGAFDCAGILVSQISNEARRERRKTGGTAQLTDQKESGDIGGVADHVVSIVGEREVTDGYAIRTIQLIKNRLGPIDTVACRFDTRWLAFVAEGNTLGEPGEEPDGPY